MNRFCITIISFIVLIQGYPQSFSDQFLPHGDFKVGYQSALFYDRGRDPLSDQLPQYQSGRAIHMTVWYPAQVKANANPMLFENYILETARQVNPPTNLQEAQVKSREFVLLSLSQLHGDTLIMKSNLTALMRSPTRAFLNATPIRQSFPIVYYPDYPHHNSIMAEALASHGFIVVSPARHGTASSDYEWQQVRGMETRIQDYQFLFAKVKEMFGLKNSSVAVIGIGMSVSDGLLWMMRSKDIKGLISMEGGILTQFECDMMKTSPFYDVQALDRSILVFHSPHKDVKPELINTFKHADRYMFYMPQLTEFYYLNYGQWESVIPGILGKSPGDTRKSFEYVFSYTLSYLNWKLKSKPEAEIEFKKSPEQKGFDTNLIQYSFKPRKDIPPSVAALEQRWQQNGFAEMKAFIEAKLKEDPNFLPYTTYYTLGLQMVNQRSAYRECLEWCELFSQQYPNATFAYSMRGRCYLELNDRQKSKSAYETAIKMIPDDPHLTSDEKEGLRYAVTQRLTMLDQ